jgi:hypothetical protein
MSQKSNPGQSFKYWDQILRHWNCRGCCWNCSHWWKTNPMISQPSIQLARWGTAPADLVICKDDVEVELVLVRATQGLEHLS